MSLWSLASIAIFLALVVVAILAPSAMSFSVVLVYVALWLYLDRRILVAKLRSKGRADFVDLVQLTRILDPIQLTNHFGPQDEQGCYQVSPAQVNNPPGNRAIRLSLQLLELGSGFFAVVAIVCWLISLDS